MEQIAAGCFADYGFDRGNNWAAAIKPLGYPVKLLWAGGAICLLIGAILAGLYALRFVYPIEWLSIQNMKIWHGTLNTMRLCNADPGGLAQISISASATRLVAFLKG